MNLVRILFVCRWNLGRRDRCLYILLERSFRNRVPDPHSSVLTTCVGSSEEPALEGLLQETVSEDSGWGPGL